MADCGVSSGQAERAQVRHALVALALYAEEFPAPDRAIESVSGAIPGNAEVRTFHMILCGTRGDMGLMMLQLGKLTGASLACRFFSKPLRPLSAMSCEKT